MKYASRKIYPKLWGFMELDLFNYQDVLETKVLSYREAQTTKEEGVWQRMASHTVGEALEAWIATLKPITGATYRINMRRLAAHGYINTGMSIQELAMMNQDSVVDRIKQDWEWPEGTKQARAATYISFTGFLCRRFEGVIKKASPCKEGTNKTFYILRDKVKTQAMSQVQWVAFIRELAKINPRDALIAKVTLQGGKRISEVLSFTTDKIDWENRRITFTQSKTGGMVKETVITYPQTVMDELKAYIGDRLGLAFVTRTGGPIRVQQFHNTFTMAGYLARVPFKVTPHVLRATCITYLRQGGFSDCSILKVTGHSSSAALSQYDKSERACNASQDVSWVA